jgi:translation elongation factor EF-G
VHRELAGFTPCSEIRPDFCGTGGRGSYSMTLSHYELVPPNVQQQITAQYAKKKEAD